MSPVVTGAQVHPADTDQNGIITTDELTAYKTACEKGDNWPVPPSPIPAGYVTNAEYLVKEGGNIVTMLRRAPLGYH
jgi:hypothetical protein